MTDFLENCPQEIIPELISYLRRLEQKGIRSLYLDRSSSEIEAAEDAVVGADVRAVVSGEPPPSAGPTQGHAAAGADETSRGDAAVGGLAEIEAVVRSCTKCPLHTGRTHAVFGVGSPVTPVMFIGEAPGRDEDLKGEPFVGRSGQLLTKILAAIDLKREDVYITNIIKCRPPQNRDPREEEVRCCEHYLVEQIELIRPALICALGRVAAQWLLQTGASLAVLRAGDHEYRGTPVLVTYHPAALLRTPSLKKAAWEDFKRLRAIISKDR